VGRNPEEPLRIAFINSWHRDTARGSGTAVAINGLAAGMRALGHEVTLVEPRGEAGRRLIWRLAFNLRAGRRLGSERYALVVGFDLDGLFAASRVAPRYVVSLKGIAADERRYERGWARWHLWMAGVLEGRNARQASRVIVTSRYARDRAVAFYGLEDSAVRIVPEGIPVGFWSERNGNGFPPRPTIVSVARFYPRKNLATLLAAMPLVRTAVPRVRLRLVGGGPGDSSLRAQAAALGLNGTVEFLGAVGDPARVREAYRGASVFCLPSLQEGFGIAFLEAMAAGLPVVGGDAGAVPEVVPDGEVGFLVPPRDVAALAAVLIRLLDNPTLRRQLGDRARRHAARYDWPFVAASFLEAALPVGAEQ